MGISRRRLRGGRGLWGLPGRPAGAGSERAGLVVSRTAGRSPAAPSPGERRLRAPVAWRVESVPGHGSGATRRAWVPPAKGGERRSETTDVCRQQVQGLNQTGVFATLERYVVLESARWGFLETGPMDQQSSVTRIRGRGRCSHKWSNGGRVRSSLMKLNLPSGMH